MIWKAGRDWRYYLSRVVPVRMSSVYGIPQHPTRPERATWWQWRGRVYRYERRVLFAAMPRRP